MDRLPKKNVTVFIALGSRWSSKRLGDLCKQCLNTEIDHCIFRFSLLVFWVSIVVSLVLSLSVGGQVRCLVGCNCAKDVIIII